MSNSTPQSAVPVLPVMTGLQAQSVIKGALLILASEFMFASMGASIKALALSGLGHEVTVFFRNLFGLLLVLPLLLNSGLSNFQTQIPHLHLLRAVFGVSAMYCFFYALGHVPLADGMLLKMTAPLFMPLLAFLWLRETASRLALWAIPIGFAGVILVIRPAGELQWASLIGLLGGLLAAQAKVTVRRLSRSEPTTRIVFYFAFFATLISIVPLLLGAWQMPTWTQWQLIILVALLGSMGQLLMTQGYSSAPAAQISPLTFFSVLFGAAYGYWFWQEILDLRFIGGAVLIAAAAMLAVKQ